MGWGFVVRGSKPCHIQAVDPGGPAAAAGMKVRTRGVNGGHVSVSASKGLEREQRVDVTIYCVLN